MVKISLDPMPAIRDAASSKVNAAFYVRTQERAYRAMAHMRKRQIAEGVKAGTEPPQEFVEEANLRNMSAEALADLILSKSNTFDSLELERQQILIQIERASTPDEVDAVMKGV